MLCSLSLSILFVTNTFDRLSESCFKKKSLKKVKPGRRSSAFDLKIKAQINRGSYMSAHVLLNLLNELGKRDKMRGLPSILSLFRNEFNKFNNTRARMLDSIYHMTNTLKSYFGCKNVMILSLCTQRCYGRHNVSRKSINH